MAAEGILYCYIGQSSSPEEMRFTLGMLVTRNPTLHFQAISALRAQNRFTRRLRSRSTDRYKIPFANGVVDYLLNQNDLSFYGAVVELANWPDEAPARDAIYFDCHRRLIERSRGFRSAVKINLIDRQTLRYSQLKRRIENLNYRPEVLMVSASSNDLMQLSSFFAGSILSDLFGTPRGARLTTLDYLKRRLGVKKIDEANLKAHPRFRINTIRA
jgi:hypothetical protein